MEMVYQVTKKGPVFTGAAPAAVHRFAEQVVEKVAQEGEDRIHNRLGSVLRNPTGHYQSRIRVNRLDTRAEITDGGIVYGPWLEGTSRRNQSTRFKGYHTFRLEAQKLQADAGRIANSMTGPLMAALN